jgi:hypothetical protein
MLKHVVIYKLKDTSDATVSRVKNTFYSMIGRVESIKDLECGYDILHTPRSFDFCLIVTFKDKEGYKQYQNHPVHLSVKAFISTVATHAAAVDFEF